ncbi:hypothetical protein HNR06_000038 [Nocardiopsis arvandica]|uniref:DUF732 domain-containing protein n=1 Tax=Nocardiopsis sinuspersici TaxID=501010 RepID=A0A7Z0BIK6_9ACTN|nr:DUF732 domain-containing protein [Nocardiopsis sinuspersici]NYH50449.1 hypothetical protein [Nocardiopsis sinuspersici]
MISLVAGLVLAAVFIAAVVWPTQERREDKAYLDMLHDHPSGSWWDGISEEGVISRGKQVCRDLDEGRSLASIAIQQMKLSVDEPLHQAALANMTEAAITVYCPHHMDEFLGYT